MPKFQVFNASNLTAGSGNQLAVFTVKLAGLDKAFFINVRPVGDNISYLICLKYGQPPVISQTTFNYDSYSIFCSNRGSFIYFSYYSLF